MPCVVACCQLLISLAAPASLCCVSLLKHSFIVVAFAQSSGEQPGPKRDGQRVCSEKLLQLVCDSLQLCALPPFPP